MTGINAYMSPYKLGPLRTCGAKFTGAETRRYNTDHGFYYYYFYYFSLGSVDI